MTRKSDEVGAGIDIDLDTVVVDVAGGNPRSVFFEQAPRALIAGERHGVFENTRAREGQGCRAGPSRSGTTARGRGEAFSKVSISRSIVFALMRGMSARRMMAPLESCGPPRAPAPESATCRPRALVLYEGTIEPGESGFDRLRRRPDDNDRGPRARLSLHPPRGGQPLAGELRENQGYRGPTKRAPRPAANMIAATAQTRLPAHSGGLGRAQRLAPHGCDHFGENGDGDSAG